MDKNLERIGPCVMIELRPGRPPVIWPVSSTEGDQESLEPLLELARSMVNLVANCEP